MNQTQLNMGFLKKLQDITEKGTELGTRGFEEIKDAAKRNQDKTKKE